MGERYPILTVLGMARHCDSEAVVGLAPGWYLVRKVKRSIYYRIAYSVDSSKQQQPLTIQFN